jgi:hypothetical protein
MLGMLSHTFQGFCYSGEVLGHQVVQILPCPYGADDNQQEPNRTASSWRATL